MLSFALRTALDGELATFRSARESGCIPGAWRALERAHILSQTALAPHLKVHWRMLAFALHLRDPREVVGQLLRLALAPLGHLIGKIPLGNTGRARTSAFAPMPLPSDLAQLLRPDQ